MLAPLTRLFSAFSRSPAAGMRPGRAGRRNARTGIFVGVLVFGLLTVGLELAAETVKPEWRDPEYGQRLRAAKKWQHNCPARPLVLVFGSSRTEYGVSPADMGFPDEPGSPLVYNFGYSGAYPLASWLHLARAFDDGLRPKAVLVELAYAHLRCDGPAEEQFPKWGPRLSEGDLRRFAPYTKDESVFRRELTAARRNPWESRRISLISDVLPEWQLNRIRANHTRWEEMDPYGRSFLRRESVTDESRRRLWESVRANAPGALSPGLPGAASDRALRDMTAACRERGVAIAFFWAPESPAFRAYYTPAALASLEAYSRTLERDLGAPVFPPPLHLAEEFFPDGFHLFPDGAAAFSRWLADEHLKPWLAQALQSNRD